MLWTCETKVRFLGLLGQLRSLKDHFAGFGHETARDEIVTMKNGLTRYQETALEAHRSRWFSLATSTCPVDRTQAEKAARQLAKIADIEVREVVWVTSPVAGHVVYETTWSSILDSLWDTLNTAIRGAMSNNLRDVLHDSLTDALGASLWDAMRIPIDDAARKLVDQSLLDVIEEKLKEPLRQSLVGSLRGLMMEQLWSWLANSVCNSLWYSDLLAYFSFIARHMRVKLDPKVRRMLSLYETLLSSAFALWLVPGKIILCERPKTVELANGCVIWMTWDTDTADEP